MLAQPDLEAVFLVTPTTLHAQQIVDALRARKHVFSEKPLSLDVGECQRVEAEAALQPDLKVMIGFVRRFDTSFRHAHARIRAGSHRASADGSLAHARQARSERLLRPLLEVERRHLRRHERARHRRRALAARRTGRAVARVRERA